MARSNPSSQQPWVQHERRQSRRMRLVVGLPVRVAHRDGTLVEISRGGARVRHAGLMRADHDVMFTFNSNGEQFTANGRVLSSRVISLGTKETGGTQFETILRFTHISAEALAMIEQMLGMDVVPAMQP